MPVKNPNALKLNRISRFYGGITINQRDVDKPGVCLNIEEFDIFSDTSFMQPETIFGADSVIANGAFDFAFDGSSAYALSNNAASPKLIKIWKKTTAGADSPGAWAAYFTSTSAFDTKEIPSMLFHSQTESSTIKTYLYYTGSPASGGLQLYRLGDISAGGTTESTTDTASTSMLMTGITTSLNTTAPRPRIRSSGESFFGHGQFIAKVSDTGVFVEKAFTLPLGYYACDFAEFSDKLYILCLNDSLPDQSVVFVWDKTSTTGFDDQILIPMGGAQAIVNHNEKIRAFCVRNAILRVYELLGKTPVKTHQLTNIQNTNTASSGYGAGGVYRPIPPQSVFKKDNIIYFGLWKTDKSGLYALGQAEENKPLALVLSRRFNTNDYSKHRPIAAGAVGPNLFVSYFDANTSPNTYVHAKLEGNNSPNRSSNAVYESIWLDSNDPETIKEWPGMMIVTNQMPTSCQIVFDAQTDLNGTYDTNSVQTLTNANDQHIDGNTTATYWYRDLTSLNGRALKFRLQVTSSTTNFVIIYTASILSRPLDLL